MNSIEGKTGPSPIEKAPRFFDDVLVRKHQIIGRNMSRDPETLLALQQLIENCRRRELTFRAVAAAVSSPQWIQQLRAWAQQQHRFAAELADHSRGFISAANGQPEGADRATELAGPPFSSYPEPLLLQACLQQQDAALAQYQEALKKAGLPRSTQFLLEAQYALLKKARAFTRRIEAGPSLQPALQLSHSS